MSQETGQGATGGEAALETAPVLVERGTAEKTAPKPRSFVFHAKIISALTFGSRVLGVFRESLAARYFGDGLVANAFSVAFAIPNLFRRLFGEGALSAAFIPLYSQQLKGSDLAESRRFAAATVNLLALTLLMLTGVGEAIIFALIYLADLNPERLLAAKLTAIMLPYALLVCGMAFLGAILQVHRRFGLVAAAPIVLNIVLIGSTIAGARLWNMNLLSGQTNAIYLISLCVLLAGAAQVMMLLPAMRQIGFRFDFTVLWTPATKKMLRLSIPVALGAGVLQLSVLLDRGISFLLAQNVSDQGVLLTHFEFFGQAIRYPMEAGASVRLFWAQLLYQFPLGVFAIAVATAIFPMLSADALDADREKFKQGLRKGIRVTIWEGLPASVGLMLVAQPAVQLLFERGQFGPNATELVSRSLQVYATAIWAFSLQQILNRAYYALHDMTTPLVLSVLTLVVNLLVEFPLMWTPLGEAGMAAGTAVSFAMQAVVMLWLLSRRTGGLGLGELRGFVLKVFVSVGVMAAACLLVQKTPIFPHDLSKNTAIVRLMILMVTGAISYIGTCMLLGIGGLEHIRPRRVG